MKSKTISNDLSIHQKIGSNLFKFSLHFISVDVPFCHNTTFFTTFHLKGPFLSLSIQTEDSTPFHDTMKSCHNGP